MILGCIEAELLRLMFLNKELGKTAAKTHQMMHKVYGYECLSFPTISE